MQDMKKTVSVLMVLMLVLTSVLLSTGSIAAEPAPQSDTPPLESEALIEALRGGGYTLYFRHEATDWSQTDYVNQAEDWLSCDGDSMRQLSDTGRERAAATGKAIRSLGIPVGRVLASPYCRTVETAQLMNLGKVTTTIEVMNLRVAEYFGGRDAIVATAQALLAKLPTKNTNTVIVAHGNVAREATPVYPDEGEGVVFQADGQGGFRYVGSILPAQWAQLNVPEEPLSTY